jgi:hypothetical protein
MTKNGFYLVILALVGQLLLHGQVATEPLQAGHDASEETPLSVSVPETGRLNLVSFLSVTVEGAFLGWLAVVYDDATTERAADYLELYNKASDLLALSWFDNFGIQRVAVDRGLLEEAAKLEGVFVVLLEGEPL